MKVCASARSCASKASRSASASLSNCCLKFSKAIEDSFVNTARCDSNSASNASILDSSCLSKRAFASLSAASIASLLRPFELSRASRTLFPASASNSARNFAISSLCFNSVSWRVTILSSADNSLSVAACSSNLKSNTCAAFNSNWDLKFSFADSISFAKFACATSIEALCSRCNSRSFSTSASFFSRAYFSLSLSACSDNIEAISFTEDLSDWSIDKASRALLTSFWSCSLFFSACASAVFVAAISNSASCVACFNATWCSAVNCALVASASLSIDLQIRSCFSFCSAKRWFKSSNRWLKPSLDSPICSLSFSSICNCHAAFSFSNVSLASAVSCCSKFSTASSFSFAASAMILSISLCKLCSNASFSANKAFFSFSIISVVEFISFTIICNFSLDASISRFSCAHESRSAAYFSFKLSYLPFKFACSSFNSNRLCFASCVSALAWLASSKAFFTFCEASATPKSSIDFNCSYLCVSSCNFCSALMASSTFDSAMAIFLFKAAITALCSSSRIRARSCSKSSVAFDSFSSASCTLSRCSCDSLCIFVNFSRSAWISANSCCVCGIEPVLFSALRAALSKSRSILPAPTTNCSLNFTKAFKVFFCDWTCPNNSFMYSGEPLSDVGLHVSNFSMSAE